MTRTRNLGFTATVVYKASRRSEQVVNGSGRKLRSAEARKLKPTLFAPTEAISNDSAVSECLFLSQRLHVVLW